MQYIETLLPLAQGLIWAFVTYKAIEILDRYLASKKEFIENVQVIEEAIEEVHQKLNELEEARISTLSLKNDMNKLLVKEGFKPSE